MNAALHPGRRLLSVEDYHRMGEAGILAPDERVELIDGEIIAMSPIGRMHRGLVNHLTRLLIEAVGTRAIVQVQSSIRLSDRSEPEPDVALLCPRADFYKRAVPGPTDVLLLIEVSDSTLTHDRDTKVPLYAKAAVPEVWIVDVRGERLVTYREPVEHGYSRELALRPVETLELAALADVTIDLSELFGDA